MRLSNIPPKKRIVAVVRPSQAFQVSRQFIVMDAVRYGARKVPFIFGFRRNPRELMERLVGSARSLVESGGPYSDD